MPNENKHRKTPPIKTFQALYEAMVEADKRGSLKIKVHYEPETEVDTACNPEIDEHRDAD